MDALIIRDAHENNLKHIDLQIPLNSFTCITGCSGSGKSSLVYDTIFAESQRRFFGGMTGNFYGRKMMDKPRVGMIENLYPALSISQTYYNVNPRSTVGTVTEITYYLRELFALLNPGTAENFFSANNPEVYCPNCCGLGAELSVSESLLIPDRSKTLKDGAILFFRGGQESKEQKTLQALCDYYNIDINKRVSDLETEELDKLLYSDEGIVCKIVYKDGRRRKQHNIFLRGAIASIREELNHNSSVKYVEEVSCHVCGGKKFRPEVLAYRAGGLNFSEAEELELSELREWLQNFSYEDIASDKREAVSQVIESIIIRLQPLINLNVEYLCLSRSIPSLSGGEKQRIRIASQIACSLRGLLYILDEPCRGLHFRDVAGIIRATRDLISSGGTVIAIEHNKQYISSADKVIELGPAGGPEGGYIIQDRKRHSQILRKPDRRLDKFFTLGNINFRNIKNQNASIPIGGITCITGVSGAGKSSFVKVIAECLRRRNTFCCQTFLGWEEIRHVIEVNQAPIGKNPRSLVISYLDIYDEIRTLLSQTDSARDLNLDASSFSVNVSGGRCECCQGTGLQKIELNYLPDCYITCPECGGKRFHSDVLSVRYMDKNIQEILDAPVCEVIELFRNSKKISRTLGSVIGLGLGYIQLGRMSMSLSGGEAQRIKLAKALGLPLGGHNLYIFDEPTTGLNDTDTAKFVKNLINLQEKHETAIIIEHNIDFVRNVADYVIDFGTLGGIKGGKIVSQGLTSNVFRDPLSSIYNL